MKLFILLLVSVVGVAYAVDPKLPPETDSPNSKQLRAQNKAARQGKMNEEFMTNDQGKQVPTQEALKDPADKQAKPKKAL